MGKLKKIKRNKECSPLFSLPLSIPLNCLTLGEKFSIYTSCTGIIASRAEMIELNCSSTSVLCQRKVTCACRWVGWLTYIVLSLFITINYDQQIDESQNKWHKNVLWIYLICLHLHFPCLSTLYCCTTFGTSAGWEVCFQGFLKTKATDKEILLIAIVSLLPFFYYSRI